MRKTKNIYNWLKTLSAILAMCFLVSNFAAAQSTIYEPAPANEMSVWEWSGIQDFVNWLIFQRTDAPRHRQKTVPQNKVNLGTPTAEDNNHKKIRIKTAIVIKDMSVREPG